MLREMKRATSVGILIFCRWHEDLKYKPRQVPPSKPSSFFFVSARELRWEDGTSFWSQPVTAPSSYPTHEIDIVPPQRR